METTDNPAQMSEGDNVYLVFGADTGDKSLSEWVDEYQRQSNSQKASSKVVQHQDVSQLNIKSQGDSVAISINGGEARVVQESYQKNSNEQTGVSQSDNQNSQVQSASFNDVDVTMIFAGESQSPSFSGWTVTDEEGTQKSVQTANAEVDQYQNVSQLNYNNQSLAFAVAVNGSDAVAGQTNYQSNKNTQVGTAKATNAADQQGQGAEQSSTQQANSSVEQNQSVKQVNINYQETAIAIAIGEGSTATAIQTSYQQNINSQVAAANASNLANQVITATGEDLMSNAAQSSSSTDQSTSSQTNTQGSEAVVDQYQDVSQANFNYQRAAVAIAVDNSSAQALQVNYQSNVNSQVGTANAANQNIQDASITMDGDSQDDAGAFEYANGNNQSSDQTAKSAVMQSQYVSQLNLNEQYSAIAVAEDCGTANAFQANFQTNVNEQKGVSNATNENDQASAANPGNQNSQPVCP